jgi:hypothetical protein
VAAKLSLAEHRAAALVILGLPGLRFLHEGQLTGARVKVPVQLGRRQLESPQADIESAYAAFLVTLKKSFVGQGTGEILAPRAAWEGNPSHQNFVVVLWSGPGSEFDLVEVNLAPHRSQAYVALNLRGLAERHWSMLDLLGTEHYERVGSDLAQHGLYLDAAPHGAQIFRFAPLP